MGWSLRLGAWPGPGLGGAGDGAVVQRGPKLGAGLRGGPLQPGDQARVVPRLQVESRAWLLATACSELTPGAWLSPQLVQEKWHLVDDLSRLLPELSPAPEPLRSRASRPRSLCPGFPCPGSPGPRTPRLRSSTVPSSSRPGSPGASDPVSRFHFPSRAEL